MTIRTALASDEAEVRRLASKLYGLREMFEGGEADWKSTYDRSKAAGGGKRYSSEAKRLRDSLGGVERQISRIIAELQVFQRAEDDFD